MIIKRIILISAALLVLVGLSQLAFASWWVSVAPGLVNSFWLAFGGVISMLFGGLLLVAVAEKLVTLRGLFVVVGVISLGVGALIVLNPAMTRDLANALVLNRTQGYQIFAIWFGGLVRILIGLALIYALIKSPGGVITTNGSPSFPETPGR